MAWDAKRVQVVFLAAVEVADSVQRAAFLDRECRDDAELRERVSALLQAHESPVSILHQPIVNDPLGPNYTLPADDDTNADESPLPIGILEPSTKPGSLGRLGHYEVLAVLGQGGFGTVVRAFDEKLHRMVAIKIMSPLLAATSPARKRFLREARSSAAICHENVVGIHAIEEQPIPFLVMEYVAGETLQQRLDRTGPLDPTDVLRIGVQVAHGLAAAHAMGKIHRDIKPANILLENGVDRVKITDFGLARAADDASLTQSGVIAGTPLYMAPEQAQGLAVDERADLFSLGSVLYVMCSGRPPFRAATTLAVLKRVAEDTPRPIREIIPEMPAWLCAVITKLHAKKPEDRFQTAQDVADVLGKCLSELQLHGQVSQDSGVRGQESEKNGPLAPVSTPAAQINPARSKRLALAFATVLLLSLVGLGLTELTGVTTFNRAVMGLFSPDDTQNGAQAAPAKVVSEPPVPRAADRRAAEYALSVGATLIIIEDGKNRSLWPGNDVPAGPFDLQVVSLIGNQKASDAGMDYFKDCKYLKNLDLEGTNISAAKIMELKRALPGCKIEADRDIVLLPDSPDRRAAEYVLSIGGLLDIKGGGLYRQADSRSALPKGAFVIRAVTLLQNQSVGDADLAIFKGCNRLEVLNLGGTKVSDTGLAHLRDCKDLAHVFLSGTQVSDDGLAHFKDHLSLKGLILNGTKITDTGLVHLKDHRSLVGLSLNATGITDTGLVHFKYWQNLGHLDLGNTQASDVGLAYFKDCKNLVRVVLAGTKVSNSGLAHLKNCKSLALLDLGNTNISDAGLVHLKQNANLAFLELNRTQVGDVGLGHLKDCRNLHHLNLANSQVSDAGLAQLLGFTRLHTLNVKNTKITAAGLKKLAAGLPTCRIECDAGMIEPTANPDPDRRVAEWLQWNAGFNVLADGIEHAVSGYRELPKSPFQMRRMRINSSPKVYDETSPIFKGLRHLTHLDILNCKVTDAALDYFNECTGLTELTLHGTNVTDAGVVRLARFGKLEYVNLNQTAVTEPAVKKLAAALPKCKIEWNGGVIAPR